MNVFRHRRPDLRNSAWAPEWSASGYRPLVGGPERSPVEASGLLALLVPQRLLRVEPFDEGEDGDGQRLQFRRGHVVLHATQFGDDRLLVALRADEVLLGAEGTEGLVNRSRTGLVAHHVPLVLGQVLP